ncbi:MAG: PilT/PilU family type 4a pilus ATPase [bacterium]
MQKLRSILNTALSRQAWCVRLVPDGQPNLVFQGQVVEVDAQITLSGSELEQMFALILPGQAFADKTVFTGTLNVGAQGVLKIRAFANPLRIDIFTPVGASLFDHMLSPVDAPRHGDVNHAPLESPPTQGFIPPVVPPAKIPAPPSFSNVSTVEEVSDKSMPPLPGVPSRPQNQSVQAPVVKVEVPMVATPAPAGEVPVESNLAQSAAIASEKPAAQQAPADLGGMFRKNPPSKKQESSVPASKVKVPPMEPVQVLKPAVPASAPVMVAAAEVIPPIARDERVEEINFGSKEAAEGSISKGQNPIDGLLREMVQMKASDMHLTVGQPVIYRIHGDIARVSQDPITPDMMRQFIFPTMPKRNQDEFSKIQDTDYAYELQNIGRFRVNIFRDRNGVGAVMRHIPSQILTAEQLGLAPAITKLCTLNKGLVLVTGPTGSGKSTTLAAMLDLINRTRKEHILTIEDPIEFVHAQQQCLVNQREVHKHTGSFSRALKAALREDPDIVLIGEMRDLETIAIAIETAETGHLVFGTLHTTTAMSTVDRIIDQFPADRQAQIRVMLSSSLRGVVAQTLLKKKTGGRVAAHEILIANDAVAAMIREGKVQHLANHMLTQKQDGNQLLNDSLLKLVQDGVVDANDAYFKAVDKNSFLAMAKQRGINVTLNAAA